MSFRLRRGVRPAGEVQFAGDDVAVRDPRNRDGGTLLFRREEWTAFVGGIENGRFDSLA